MSNTKKPLAGIITAIVASVLVIAIAVGVIVWKWPDITKSFNKTDSETTSSQAGTSSGEDAEKNDGTTGIDGNVITQDTGKKSVDVVDVVASTGDKQIVVPVYATQNPGIVAARLFITFDTNAFSFAECRSGDIFDNCQGQFNEKENKLTVLAMNGADDSTDIISKSGAGVLTNIVLIPKSGAKPGTYKIKIESNSEFANLDDQLINIKTETGNIILK